MNRALRLICSSGWFTNEICLTSQEVLAYNRDLIDF